MKTHWSFRLAAVVGGAAVSAWGADPRDLTWDPGASGFTWDNSGNWVPGSLWPDDYFDRAIFNAAAGNPEVDSDIQGSGGGLGQLVFNTAGWTVQDLGSFTMYLNSIDFQVVPNESYYGYNAIFSSGAGINAINTRIQFVTGAQNIYTASGNTLVIAGGFTGSFAPVISSMNPTANDTGAVRLDVASSVSGAFYVRQGTLLVRHSDGLGSSAATLNLGGDQYVSDGANARLLTDASGVTIAKNIAVRTYSGHEVNATLGGNQTAGASTFSGTVTLNRSANLTSANTDGNAVSFNNAISGAGGITKIGAGTVTLNHANTYGGATAITTGRLKLGATGALPSSTDVTLANTAGAVLDLNGYNQTVNSLGGGGGAGGNVTLGTAFLTVGSGSFSGVISGTGGLTKTGAGTLTLGGANAYGGLTTISSGTLAYGADNVLSSGAVTINGSPAVLSLGTHSDTVGAVTLDGGGQITGSGVLNSTSGFDFKSGTVSAPLAGTVGLSKTTGGTVTLGAANTFSGETRLYAGTLVVAHLLALQNSMLNLDVADTGTLSLSALDATLGGLKGGRDLVIPASRTLTVGNDGTSSTYSGALLGSGSGLTKIGGGTLILGGNSSYSGLTTISGGVLQLGAGGTAGALTSAVEDNAMLQFNRSDDVVFGLTISGSGSLTKLGAAKLTLNGDNSYSGSTFVRAGTLLVNGTHAGAGLYQIGESAAGGGGSGGKPGATLGGTGNIGGSVLVNGGSIVSPGSSLGTLEVAGALTLNGTLRIELDGTGGGASDALNVHGELDITRGAVDFQNLTSLDDPAYVFAFYGSLKGDQFLTSNPPSGYSIDYHYQGANQIALVVPEPASGSVLLLALSGWMTLTRRVRSRESAGA